MIDRRYHTTDVQPGLASTRSQVGDRRTLDWRRRSLPGVCARPAVAVRWEHRVRLDVGSANRLGLGTGGHRRHHLQCDFSNNRVVGRRWVTVSSPVTGAVGGTFSIGVAEIRTPIPIRLPDPARVVDDVLEQQPAEANGQELRSWPPRESLGSDNETGGRHRAPAASNSAIAEVKTAVKTAVECDAVEAAARRVRTRTTNPSWRRGLVAAAEFLDERLGLVPCRQQARGLDLVERRRLGIAAGQHVIGARPSMSSAGSVARMVCSRAGSYPAEHRYITVESSCSARKPCAKPSLR